MFQSCSGLVDLVVCVRHHGGGVHHLAGERFVGRVAEDIAAAGEPGTAQLGPSLGLSGGWVYCANPAFDPEWRRIAATAENDLAGVAVPDDVIDPSRMFLEVAFGDDRDDKVTGSLRASVNRGDTTE